MIPVVLLTACGLYLGVQGWSAANTVLHPVPASSLATGTTSVAAIEQARSNDRVLLEASVEGRDPLHRKPRPVQASTPVRKKAPEPLTPPALRMILVDSVSPVVQIEVDGILSDRLKVGQVFQGWKVDSIASGLVVVSKDGESFSLTSRRSQ